MNPLAPLAAALAVTALWLAWKIRQASAHRKASRAGYFDAVLPLFDRVTRRIEPTGFPRMTAHVGALAFDLQAVQDSLSFRKLPVLWVMLSLPGPLPVKATLDIMARPSGQEPFSHFAQLPQSLPAMDELPEGTAIRSDDADLVPAQALIAPHMTVFADPKVKEMVISPKGLRIVFMADEADRGRFLIFREAELGMRPLPPGNLMPLVDTLLALRRSLMENR